MTSAVFAFLAPVAPSRDATRLGMMLDQARHADRMPHAQLPIPIRGAYAMGMPLLHTDWSAAQAMALPDDGNRWEVLDGELVVMPPPCWAPQVAVEQFYLTLHAHVREQALGWVKRLPSAVVLSERRLVQPVDGAVAPHTCDRASIRRARSGC